MTSAYIQTRSLTLVPNTLEEVRALIEGMDAEQRAELSPDWLARSLKKTRSQSSSRRRSVSQSSDVPAWLPATKDVSFGAIPELTFRGQPSEAEPGAVKRRSVSFENSTHNP